jgi:hypothetical protein
MNPTLTKNGYTAIPLATVTPEQQAAAKAAGWTPKTPVTEPAPVTAPARTPGLLQSAQEEAASLASARASARREADRYAASMREARISAINQAFAPRIQREKDEGEARLSRVAALNFRTGTIGSGVDTTRTGEQKGQNEKALQAIEAEKAAAIDEVFGWADQLAKDRAAEIYQGKKEDAEANVTLYKERADQAMNALEVLGAQGVDAKSLQEVDPKVYETLRDVSGMSDAQIDAYLKAKAPEGVYQWSAAQVAGSKMLVPKVVNGKVTMESLELGYTPGKEYKTAVKTDEGVLVIYSDGTYDVIGGKSSGAKLKAGAPSWEQYLQAAENAAQMNLSNESRAKLREQYDRAFVLTDVSDFTSTEKKKLEQAGLLTAPRKEQLDFLYGDDGGGIDFSQAE